MIDIKDYGYKSEIPDDKIIARITAVFRERYEIACKYGLTYARLKSAVYYNNNKDTEFPTVGDFVEIDYNSSGDSQIINTLERKTLFVRSDFSGHEASYAKTIVKQVVASNFDYVFILQSLNNDFNIGRLQRYITISWESGAVPVLILTKADLINDYTDILIEAQNVCVGVDIFVVSAVNGYGMDELEKFLKPQTTVALLGSSGVGKSTLLNYLAKKDIMKVNTIREDDSKGRHTTTHRQLVLLDSGVMVIDTPGMRELGVWDISKGLSVSFSDIEELINQCRFNNCTHTNEPGCSINNAIEQGALSKDRWQDYLKLKKEAKYVEDRNAYKRDKSARNKANAIHSKNKKRNNRVY